MHTSTSTGSSLASCGRVWPATVSVHRQPSTRRRVLAAEAFAHSYAGHDSGRGGATYERVLRYPDGLERRIRYPLPALEDLSTDACEDWETLNTWKGIGFSAPTRRRNEKPIRLPESAPATPAAERQLDSPIVHEGIPASPLELLRFLNSPGHRRAQRAEWERVHGSYSILEGCPWPVPRPLYVLAAAHPDSSVGLTHTHRTRLPRADIEGELSAVLGGRRRGDGSPLIRCGEVVDGVVAFEDEADAEEYGLVLDAGLAAGGAAHRITRCDSHVLFRGVREACGVVVLLRRGVAVPRPHQLAAALRGQTSLDDED